MFRSALLAGSLLAGMLPAQVGTQLPPELVGLTHKTPSVARIALGAAGCKASACSASATGLRGRPVASAGGVAWDARLGKLWASDGVSLSVLDVRGTSTACGLACKPIAVPQPSTGTTSYVAGMTIVEAGLQNAPGAPAASGVLVLGYTTQEIGVVPYKGCALGTPSYCSLARVLGTSRFIGALAADDVRQLVLVATSSMIATSPANVIYLCRLGSPCVPVCKFTVAVDQSVCANVRLGPITGMAYDGCRQRLFVTDGRTIVHGTLTITSASSSYSCGFKHTGCCAGVSTEEFVGLSIAPAAPVSVGQGCATSGCNACGATMRAGIVGDPVLGNGDFALRLDGAPANAGATVLGIGFGACGQGVGLGFCGPIRIAFAPAPPLTFFFGGLGGGSGCTGALKIPVALPTTPSLCDLDLSVQWITACPNGGSAVSPCLSLHLQSL